MDTREYVIARQLAWARSRKLALVGSAVERGRQCYTKAPDQNFFEPLSPEVKDMIGRGSGGELGDADTPGKIQALHSSSALGVNVFHYWRQQKRVSEVAAHCGLCKKGSDPCGDLLFEEKLSISGIERIPPNMDVLISNRPGQKFRAFAIECKFTEAYGGREHAGVQAAYLSQKNLWDELPALRTLAEKISPSDSEFQYLHAAQLVKHVLGLECKYGHSKYRLLYLWYDAFGEPGTTHRREVERFAEVAELDGIHFHSLTYQELIQRLVAVDDPRDKEYVGYLAARYM